MIFLLVFIPLGFAFQSIILLLIAPWQFIGILFNKRLRQNHALEHATVNVIEQRYGVRNLAGLAYKEGFTIKGGVFPPEVVLSAAKEGLYRLRSGESELAIHPRCGTTLVVINLLSAVLFILLLFITDALSLINVIVAILLAHLMGPLFGRLVQKYITTSSDVSDVEIVGIEVRGFTYKAGMFFTKFLPEEYFVRTTTVKDRLKVEVIE